MPQGNTTLISARTTATTKEFTVMDNHAVTLVAWGFSTTVDDAKVDIQISYDGTNYVNCFKDGTQVRLTSVNNPLTIYGPGKFLINKAITTGSVGVAMWEQPNGL